MEDGYVIREENDIIHSVNKLSAHYVRINKSPLKSSYPRQAKSLVANTKQTQQ